MTSQFLLKHQALFNAIKAAYPESNSYYVNKSETELMYSKFPAIGIFLDTSKNGKEGLSYKQLSYTYILSTFDIFDNSEPTSQIDKQRTMFDLIEHIINSQNYHVVIDIEPIVSVAIDAGEFITGWSTIIEFKA